jgi:hypothetical protein
MPVDGSFHYIVESKNRHPDIAELFTLRNIIEQRAEWNSLLCANFADFEIAFDSIHRESLWLVIKYYGIMFSVCSVKFHYFSFGSVYFQGDMAGVFLFSLFDCTCSYLNEINTRSSSFV